MTRSLSPRSQLSDTERALLSPDPSNSISGSSHGASGEDSTIFHVCTSIISFLAPTARSKCKADELGDEDRQAKQQRSLAPVAMADGHRPLKKTWDSSALKNRRGLLAKFQVGPLPRCPMFILTFKGTHSPCCRQKTRLVGQLGRPIIQVERES